MFTFDIREIRAIVWTITTSTNKYRNKKNREIEEELRGLAVVNLIEKRLKWLVQM